MQYVIPFEEIKKEDVLTAGGKGANLGEMTAAGIPVPRGAVVSAKGYDLFMTENNIDPAVFENPSELRNTIKKGKLPIELEGEVRNYYALLGAGTRVAVRSSATAEDLEDASFAGQQETYLNVIGIDVLLQKIIECYASLWGDRAVSYRKTAGYDKQKVSLAVVIQEMVESESSGVMFTSDPAGDPDNLHINASYGLGEAVVSGIVSPDEYICDRNGNIKNIIIGSKECQIIYDINKTAENGQNNDISGQGGTIKVDVEKTLRSAQVLNNSVIKELIREGIRIEEHYGHPMDIEWAVKDGKIYILQARAITTLGEKKEKGYSEAEMAALPKVKPATGRMRENVLFNMEKTPTPYYPLDHDFGGIVGEQKGVLFEEIGLKFGENMYPIDKDGINYLSASKPKITRRIFKLPHYFKLVKDIDGNVENSEKTYKKWQSKFEELQKKNLRTLKDYSKAFQYMRKLIAKTAYDRFLYALFPNAVESMKVNKVLKKLPGDLNCYDLLDGLSYVTADINREMAELAEWIKKNEQIRKSIENDDYNTLTDKYPELKSRLEAFLAKYGSKSDFNCYCFISRSWREEPDRFLNVLKPMIKAEENKTPSKEEGLQRYNNILKQVEGILSPKKYADFKRRAEALRHYHYIREATQYLWESEFEYCRKLLRETAKISGKGYNDYLYLFADEFIDVLENGWDSKISKIVDHRKAKRALAEGYWIKANEDALVNESGEVTGICGSSGKARGEVCVVKSPKEFDKLKKGDILVCTYTDPEWTPLFCLAAGVVVDTGGTLSHAAIVAREYNIPAILACGDATKKLKDGDAVLVDADQGKVIKI